MTETKRRLQPDPSLLLREVEESDARTIFDLVEANRVHLGRWLVFVHATRSEADTLAFVRDVSARSREGRGHAFLIESSGVPCGVIGLDPIEMQHERAAIGYWLAEGAQGRGVMTRALESVVRYAFDELGLNRLALHTAVDNLRSRAVAERVGFREEGLHRQAERNLDRRLDMISYALLRSDPIPEPMERRPRARRRALSKTTLYGRVHEQVRHESLRDVDALYEMIDPERRPASDDRAATDALRAEIEEHVGAIRTALCEDVQVLRAVRESPDADGRSAAQVRTTIRYDDAPTTVTVETDWVRSGDVWYVTRYPPDAPDSNDRGD